MGNFFVHAYIQTVAACSLLPPALLSSPQHHTGHSQCLTACHVSRGRGQLLTLAWSVVSSGCSATMRLQHSTPVTLMYNCCTIRTYIVYHLVQMSLCTNLVRPPLLHVGRVLLHTCWENEGLGIWRYATYYVCTYTHVHVCTVCMQASVSTARLQGGCPIPHPYDLTKAWGQPLIISSTTGTLTPLHNNLLWKPCV